MNALAEAQTRVIDAVRTEGPIGRVSVRSLIPDLPPGAPVQIDNSTIESGVQAPADVAFVDLDQSEGPVLRFLPVAEDAPAVFRVQLLMTFPDTEPLPLGEMQVHYDTTTGELTYGTGLAY